MINVLTAAEKEIVAVVPELLALKETVENSRNWHKNDTVYDHTMRVFSRVKENLHLEFVAKPQYLKQYLAETVGKLSRAQLLLWAALFHDIAKPDTITTVDGFTKCPGHEVLGAKKAKQILSPVIAGKLDLNRIVRIINNHDNLSCLMISTDIHLDERVAHLEQSVDIFPELVLLTLSDMEGSQLPEIMPDEFAFRLKKYRYWLNQWR